jgi:sugar/nucleoside kinase (ribokinase family)
MIFPQTNCEPSAVHATICSFLGLSARDVAEIGSFSERFARDLLAGRRPFPPDTRVALEQQVLDWDAIRQAIILEIEAGERTFYIYRTNEQLRASQMGKALNATGKAAVAFVGPYRAAIFAAWRAAQSKGIEVQLVFASWPQMAASE